MQPSAQGMNVKSQKEAKEAIDVIERSSVVDHSMDILGISQPVILKKKFGEKEIKPSTSLWKIILIMVIVLIIGWICCYLADNLYLWISSSGHISAAQKVINHGAGLSMFKSS